MCVVCAFEPTQKLLASNNKNNVIKFNVTNANGIARIKKKIKQPIEKKNAHETNKYEMNEKKQERKWKKNTTRTENQSQNTEQQTTLKAKHTYTTTAIEYYLFWMGI